MKNKPREFRFFRQQNIANRAVLHECLVFCLLASSLMSPQTFAKEIDINGSVKPELKESEFPQQHEVDTLTAQLIMGFFCSIILIYAIYCVYREARACYRNGLHSLLELNSRRDP